MDLQSFISLIESDNQRHPGVHEIYPAASDQDLRGWRDANTTYRLPDDIATFYRWSNGLGIWRQRMGGEYISDGAVLFFPISNVRPASYAMYDLPSHDIIRASWFALATEENGEWFLILDLDQNRYMNVPPIVPAEATLIGNSFGDLLEWVVKDQELVGGRLPED